MDMNLREAKPGDKVKSITKGWGVVKEVYDNSTFKPLQVKFGTHPERVFYYHYSGRDNEADLYPEIIEWDATGIRYDLMAAIDNVLVLADYGLDVSEDREDDDHELYEAAYQVVVEFSAFNGPSDAFKEELRQLLIEDQISAWDVVQQVPGCLPAMALHYKTQVEERMGR